MGKEEKERKKGLDREELTPIQFLIAFLHKDGKQYGARILTTNFIDFKKVEDVETNKLYLRYIFNAKVNKKGEIESVARDENDQYREMNGSKKPSFNKYPIIDKDTGKIKNKSYIIICRTIYGDKEGFGLSDANGNIKFMSEEDARKFITEKGGKDRIANGTLTSGGVIKNAVGNYWNVPKIEIIDKNDKKWDLSDEKKKPIEHIKAILENRDIENEISVAQGKEVFKMLLKDNNFIDKLGLSVRECDTKKLGDLLTEFYNKYEKILNNCVEGKKFKKSIALILKDLKKNNFIQEVELYIKQNIRLEDCM